MIELSDIRQQIMTMRSRLIEPKKIYMDRKTTDLLVDEMHAICRYEGALKSGWQIYGLRVKVHDDFPNPIVTP